MLTFQSIETSYNSEMEENCEYGNNDLLTFQSIETTPQLVYQTILERNNDLLTFQSIETLLDQWDLKSALEVTMTCSLSRALKQST